MPVDRQFSVSVISSAAQDLRPFSGEGPFDRELTLQKMRSSLWAAAHYGHRAVVLGAFGCGAFQNDPKVIAELYRSLLCRDGEFGGRFDIVLFAIIKSRDNLRAFGSHFPLLSEMHR